MGVVKPGADFSYGYVEVGVVNAQLSLQLQPAPIRAILRALG